MTEGGRGRSIGLPRSCTAGLAASALLAGVALLSSVTLATLPPNVSAEVASMMVLLCFLPCRELGREGGGGVPRLLPVLCSLIDGSS